MAQVASRAKWKRLIAVASSGIAFGLAIRLRSTKKTAEAEIETKTHHVKVLSDHVQVLLDTISSQENEKKAAVKALEDYRARLWSNQRGEYDALLAQVRPALTTPEVSSPSLGAVPASQGLFCY